MAGDTAQLNEIQMVEVKPMKGGEKSQSYVYYGQI